MPYRLSDFVAIATKYATNNGHTPEQINGWSRDDIIGICGIPYDESDPRGEIDPKNIVFCKSIRDAVSLERHNEIQAEADTRFTIKDTGNDAIVAAAVADPALKKSILDLALKDPTLTELASLIIAATTVGP